MMQSDTPLQNRTVLISGAGIAGPTLAYWLLEKGFTPTIVEHSPALRTGGYMIDFWGTGYDVAERMGLLPKIYRDGYLLDEVRIVDEDGKRLAGFDAKVFQAASDDRFISIMRGDLARLIYEQLRGRAEVIFGDTITRLDDDGSRVHVTFESAPPRDFDLVVGADGLHSNVRNLAFGDGASYEKFLGYYTAAFSVDSYPHRDESAFVSYSVPGAQISRYALRDGRSAFFFFFASDDRQQSIPHDVDAQKDVIRRNFAGSGWESDEILRAMDRTTDFYFDAAAQIRMDCWSKGRITLVGDAAYCPSLLAGQGSALAMSGAYLLAYALGDARGDHRIAFEDYQSRFKPFVTAKQRGAESFGPWFAPRTRLGMKIRNIGTNLLSDGWLASRLIRRSFSDHLDLPVES